MIANFFRAISVLDSPLAQVLTDNSLQANSNGGDLAHIPYQARTIDPFESNSNLPQASGDNLFQLNNNLASVSSNGDPN